MRRTLLAQRVTAEGGIAATPREADVWTDLARLGGFESFDDVPTTAEAATGLSASVAATRRAAGEAAAVAATRDVASARLRAAYAAERSGGEVGRGGGGGGAGARGAYGGARRGGSAAFASPSAPRRGFPGSPPSPRAGGGSGSGGSLAQRRAAYREARAREAQRGSGPYYAR